MKIYFIMLKKYKIFNQGDGVKVSTEEKPKKGDYVIIKTKSGYRLTKYRFSIKYCIVGKVISKISTI